MHLVSVCLTFLLFKLANYLKITQNIAFELLNFWHFPPIFVLLKLTCLITLFDRKLHVFKSSPKWTIFGILKVLLDIFCYFQIPWFKGKILTFLIFSRYLSSSMANGLRILGLGWPVPLSIVLCSRSHFQATASRIANQIK